MGRLERSQHRGATGRLFQAGERTLGQEKGKKKKFSVARAAYAEEMRWRR